MKKAVSMLLALVMVLSCVACGKKPEEKDDTYHIGIVTGSVSQSEDDRRGAEAFQAEYGEDMVKLATYPDNFGDELETTIQTIVNMSADPQMKAIIVNQSVPGVTEAFRKIKESRPDILCIAGESHEDLPEIGSAADLVCNNDFVARGYLIIRTAHELGCDTFVHISFPRHLAMETIAARKALLEENAAALGIQYVEATAPDPTGDAGVAGAQQFILEDVPLKLKEFEGKKVAFFTTNCGMQEPLQAAILDQPNAYYPQPCCPSPYHAFPASLGLEIKAGGDDTEALKAIAAVLKEHNALGRYSTWPSPVNMSIIDVSVEYAKKWIAGEITSKNDGAAIAAMFEEKAPGAIVSNYTNADGQTFDNYYTVLLGAVDFNDYAE